MFPRGSGSGLCQELTLTVPGHGPGTWTCPGWTQRPEQEEILAGHPSAAPSFSDSAP